MVVNGLRLPDAFEQAVQEGRTARIYRLKGDQDAYGDRLETQIGTIYTDEETMANETAELAEAHSHDLEIPEGLTEEARPYSHDPGFVPYTTDFSKIVSFGHSGEASPFCFDFRENPERPSVLYWDDVYWRRVAPDFESFLDLFLEQ